MKKDARKAIEDVFAAAGYTPHQIAGVLAHAERESGFDVNIKGDKGASRGLFQWQGPRLKALKQFAAEKGVRVDDPTTQAMFAVQELQSSESKAGKLLQSAKTPRDASIAMNQFERFSHNGGYKNTNVGESAKRIAAAERYGKEPIVANLDPATKSVQDFITQPDGIPTQDIKPLEKELAQALSYGDEDNNPNDADDLVQTASMRIPRPDAPVNMHGQSVPIDPNGWPKGTERFAAPPLGKQDEGVTEWRAPDVDRATDDGMKEAEPLLGKPEAPMPKTPTKPKPLELTTEDEIIRQILKEEQLGNDVAKATGLDATGNVLDNTPTANMRGAATMVGGGAGISAATAFDPNSNAQQQQSGFQPVEAASPPLPPVDPRQSLQNLPFPPWLEEAVGGPLGLAVQHAAQTDPAVAPAADTVAKSVVRSMAQQNDGGYYQRLASEMGFTGDSGEMMRAVQQDSAGIQPPMQQPMQQNVPLPQPKPQDQPIDVSSFINGGTWGLG